MNDAIFDREKMHEYDYALHIYSSKFKPKPFGTTKIL